MKRALVAYFSVSGVTAKLAQKLAGQIGADVFEIQALSPTRRRISTGATARAAAQ